VVEKFVSIGDRFEKSRILAATFRARIANASRAVSPARTMTVEATPAPFREALISQTSKRIAINRKSLYD